VRNTLEQIDITRRFIQEYPSTFQYCDTPKCAREAFKAGRIASMIGIEGGHQVGSEYHFVSGDLDADETLKTLQVQSVKCTIWERGI
jgi:microsomal dipeptidase-like Zn-dependent dipeptidase